MKGEYKEVFLKYLKLSAEGGNVTAQFHLGDTYFKGKLGIEKDETKGKNYLVLAAQKRHPKAIEMCNKLEINFN